jgi:phenylacetaldehyde dehydrogenase
MTVIDRPQNIALPQPVRAFLKKQHKLLIDGKWVDAKSGKTFDVIDPATGEVITKVAAGDAADVELAVAAARRAFDRGPWGKTKGLERAKLLWKLADKVDEHAEELATLESIDNGKPIRLARMGDIPGSAETLRYNAGWAGKITGDTIPASLPGNFHSYTLREPVGVVGAIIPWNFPLAMAVAKLGPALAAGCTVVLKPAEQTPLTALRLGDFIAEVGFPEGVINIVTGFGETAGAAIVDHPQVDKVAFTGSTATGKAIVRACAATLKRVSLELGGKSPTVILPDADLSKAIAGASRSIFFNSGQVCAAGSRLFAHKKIFEDVVSGIAEEAKRLKVGPGIVPETEIGPLVSEEQFERVTGYLQAGTNEGARVLVGGNAIGSRGYFVEPTILANTDRAMSVRQEEIFGPVLCAMSFDDEDLEKIADEANDTTYGLAATIWTRDISAGHKLAKLLKAGSIRINGGGLDHAVPFGGYKQSGWGRENGKDGVELFTEVKAISVNLA